MSDQKIKVSIDVIGKPTIEAFGFTGGSCKTATQPIIDALSHRGETLSEVEKPELHMSEDMSSEMHMGN